ncbi:MAG: hypothetical protein ACPL25_03295 [Ignavibacteria bacterium]
MNRKLIFSILLIGLLLRIIISFSIEYSIIHGISSDDSYYYFRIAQNIASGYGSTFDQINRTNGYQPLVLWFLVIIYSGFNSELLIPVIISQILLSIVSTIAAYLTYHFIKKIYQNEFAALLLIVFLFLNPVIIAINFKSLETNFYWLFLIISLFYFERFLRYENGERKYLHLFVFGSIISFVAFSRLDGGFYILAFSVYLLFLKNIKFTERIRRVFFAGFGFSILFVPYLIYNYLSFGHFVPISGRAKVFHNHKAVLSQVGDYFTLDFFLYELRRFFFPFNFDLFANRGFGLIEQIAVYIVIAILIIIIVLFLKSGYLKKAFSHFKGYGFILVYLFFHYSFYTLYFWEYRFYYFLPEIITLAIILSMMISKWIEDRFSSKKVLANQIVLILVILIFTIGGIKIFTAQHEQTLAYKTAKWIKENIPENKILGSANTGILSYFTQMRFVNLDGMVNNDELINAYKVGSEKYVEYLKKNRIEYIVDYFLSDKPENKYYFPELLNDKYEVIKVFTDNRLKYQKLNHMLVIKLRL